MHTALIGVLKLIYPIRESNLRRDRPLEVLALGISRSGTDSLRQALFELGYHDVHHGFRMGERSGESIQWIRLAQAQMDHNSQFLTANEFDKVIGDCSAITDIPCAGFAQQLIDLYLNAKVILNYREDLDAWGKSVTNSIDKAVKGISWYSWMLTFFQPDLFWDQRRHWYVWYRYFDDDFEHKGQAWYRQHYRDLEARLPAQRLLRWRVEEGWEPLCKFLDKPLPQLEFPNGNAPESFLKHVLITHARWVAQAQRNFCLSLATVTVLAVAGGINIYYRASNLH